MSGQHYIFHKSDSGQMGRREFIKITSAAGIGLALSKPLAAFSQSQDSKMIIIYFSHSGNTRIVAQEIQSFTHADMTEIAPKVPFPENYNALVQLAEKQAAEHFHPEFTVNLPRDLDSFNVIFLGFPIWAYTMPMIIYSFLDKYKFPGKKIAPFCTHMGSGLADSMQMIKELCPQATILPGLAIRGTNAANSSGEVKAWLQKNGLII